LFFLFAAVLTVALLSFGAVQAHAYVLLAMVCLVLAAGYLLLQIGNSGRLPLAAFLWFGALVAVSMLNIKSALPVFGVGWCWIAVQRAPKKTMTFLHVLILLGVGEAVLGLIQYFVLPGWIFGYQNPQYISSGTLINRNHYAGLLEMILPATIGLAYIWAHRTRDVFRSYFYVLIGVFLGIGLIFSTSRMGIFAGLSTVLILGSAVRFKHATKGATILVLSLVIIISAGALWIGIDVVISRYAELAGADSLIQEGRMLVYSDTLRMVRAHPWGIGLGNYRDVFKQYQTWRPDLLVDHAHNDYLETAAEWGIVPALVFWIVILGVLILGFRRFVETQSVERAGLLLTSIGAVLSILLHSLTDFNLQIPSNAMLFCGFLGMLLAASSRTPIPPLTND